jgi:hypothetical protein
MVQMMVFLAIIVFLFFFMIFKGYLYLAGR